MNKAFCCWTKKTSFRWGVSERRKVQCVIRQQAVHNIEVVQNIKLRIFKKITFLSLHIPTGMKHQYNIQTEFQVDFLSTGEKKFNGNEKLRKEEIPFTDSNGLLFIHTMWCALTFNPDIRLESK